MQGAARTLDFTQPIAIMLMGILGHIADDDEARSIVKRLLAAVPSGSYLAMNDGSDTSEEVVEAHASGTSPPTRPTTSAAPIGSLASSTASSSWNPASSPLHDGAPSPARPASRPRSIRSVASRASRNAVVTASASSTQWEWRSAAAFCSSTARSAMLNRSS